MTRESTSAKPPGRPRAGIDAVVFAATLKTVHELGYASATMDRIAAAAGVAKTTIYRRWPSKGALITDCLVDTFGPLPPMPGSRAEYLAAAIDLAATKISRPGVGAAFAGVFVDAVSDASLREILSTRLQAPYLRALQDALGEPEDRILLFVDITVGTLLHRMGMTGAPMADADVAVMTEMIQHHFAGPAR
ncbi:TetR family transcriptional regulator [Saccharothrix saharensis]|uniref:TetR family transcriptional regulator n=1 Tax=Saccharothrix saharensis TaxID=571190 RepID=A0A543J777_9PSEU|nr:TetR/AcrR family transcriptional regulator [Saccharothrix saharensis]TQM78648.1 TetR family transcriptional regulator [Saccharothrix saharensis]